jgi:PLP dependent protein
MAIDKQAYEKLKTSLNEKGVALVAVSKTKPVADILALYELGQRDFGENYVQELVEKQAQLPADIRWHFIGHLQSNKVKYIAPFVHLIHAVDSVRLLGEIDKQAAKGQRHIHCLLQVHIAEEETKFGFDKTELREAVTGLTRLEHVHVDGLMGMASFSDDPTKVKAEFHSLHSIFRETTKANPSLKWTILSMGMSADYAIAVEEGGNLVRIGSLLFGSRS